MKIGEFNIELENMVYEPSDDSFLLIDNLNINPGEKFLK